MSSESAPLVALFHVELRKNVTVHKDVVETTAFTATKWSGKGSGPVEQLQVEFQLELPTVSLSDTGGRARTVTGRRGGGPSGRRP
jgi:hypothetical protein